MLTDAYREALKLSRTHGTPISSTPLTIIDTASPLIVAATNNADTNDDAHQLRLISADKTDAVRAMFDGTTDLAFWTFQSANTLALAEHSAGDSVDDEHLITSDGDEHPFSTSAEAIQYGLRLKGHQVVASQLDGVYRLYRVALSSVIDGGGGDDESVSTTVSRCRLVYQRRLLVMGRYVPVFTTADNTAPLPTLAVPSALVGLDGVYASASRSPVPALEWYRYEPVTDDDARASERSLREELIALRKDLAVLAKVGEADALDDRVTKELIAQLDALFGDGGSGSRPYRLGRLEYEALLRLSAHKSLATLTWSDVAETLAGDEWQMFMRIRGAWLPREYTRLASDGHTYWRVQEPVSDSLYVAIYRLPSSEQRYPLALFELICLPPHAAVFDSDAYPSHLDAFSATGASTSALDGSQGRVQWYQLASPLSDDTLAAVDSASSSSANAIMGALALALTRESTALATSGSLNQYIHEGEVLSPPLATTTTNTVVAPLLLLAMQDGRATWPLFGISDLPSLRDRQHLPLSPLPSSPSSSSSSSTNLFGVVTQHGAPSLRFFNDVIVKPRHLISIHVLLSAAAAVSAKKKAGTTSLSKDDVLRLFEETNTAIYDDDAEQHLRHEHEHASLEPRLLAGVTDLPYDALIASGASRADVAAQVKAAFVDELAASRRQGSDTLWVARVRNVLKTRAAALYWLYTIGSGLVDKQRIAWLASLDRFTLAVQCRLYRVLGSSDAYYSFTSRDGVDHLVPLLLRENSDEHIALLDETTGQLTAEAVRWLNYLVETHASSMMPLMADYPESMRTLYQDNDDGASLLSFLDVPLLYELRRRAQNEAFQHTTTQLGQREFERWFTRVVRTGSAEFYALLVSTVPSLATASFNNVVWAALLEKMQQLGGARVARVAHDMQVRTTLLSSLAAQHNVSLDITTVGNIKAVLAMLGASASSLGDLERHFVDEFWLVEDNDDDNVPTLPHVPVPFDLQPRDEDAVYPLLDDLRSENHYEVTLRMWTLSDRELTRLVRAASATGDATTLRLLWACHVYGRLRLRGRHALVNVPESTDSTMASLFGEAVKRLVLAHPEQRARLYLVPNSTERWQRVPWFDSDDTERTLVLANGYLPDEAANVHASDAVWAHVNALAQRRNTMRPRYLPLLLVMPRGGEARATALERLRLQQEQEAREAEEARRRAEAEEQERRRQAAAEAEAKRRADEEAEALRRRQQQEAEARAKAEADRLEQEHRARYTTAAAALHAEIALLPSAITARLDELKGEALADAASRAVRAAALAHMQEWLNAQLAGKDSLSPIEVAELERLFSEEAARERLHYADAIDEAVSFLEDRRDNRALADLDAAMQRLRDRLAQLARLSPQQQASLATHVDKATAERRALIEEHERRARAAQEEADAKRRAKEAAREAVAKLAEAAEAEQRKRQAEQRALAAQEQDARLKAEEEATRLAEEAARLDAEATQRKQAAAAAEQAAKDATERRRQEEAREAEERARAEQEAESAAAAAAATTLPPTAAAATTTTPLQPKPSSSSTIEQEIGSIQKQIDEIAAARKALNDGNDPSGDKRNNLQDQLKGLRQQLRTLQQQQKKKMGHQITAVLPATTTTTTTRPSDTTSTVRGICKTVRKRVDLLELVIVEAMRLGRGATVTAGPWRQTLLTTIDGLIRTLRKYRNVLRAAVDDDEELQEEDAPSLLEGLYDETTHGRTADFERQLNTRIGYTDTMTSLFDLLAELDAQDPRVLQRFSWRADMLPVARDKLVERFEPSGSVTASPSLLAAEAAVRSFARFRLPPPLGAGDWRSWDTVYPPSSALRLEGNAAQEARLRMVRAHARSIMTALNDEQLDRVSRAADALIDNASLPLLGDANTTFESLLCYRHDTSTTNNKLVWRSPLVIGGRVWRQLPHALRAQYVPVDSPSALARELNAITNRRVWQDALLPQVAVANRLLERPLIENRSEFYDQTTSAERVAMEKTLFAELLSKLPADMVCYVRTVQYLGAEEDFVEVRKAAALYSPSALEQSGGKGGAENRDIVLRYQTLLAQVGNDVAKAQFNALVDEPLDSAKINSAFVRPDAATMDARTSLVRAAMIYRQFAALDNALFGKTAMATIRHHLGSAEATNPLLELSVRRLALEVLLSGIAAPDAALYWLQQQQQQQLLAPDGLSCMLVDYVERDLHYAVRGPPSWSLNSKSTPPPSALATLVQQQATLPQGDRDHFVELTQATLGEMWRAKKPNPPSVARQEHALQVWPQPDRVGSGATQQQPPIAFCYALSQPNLGAINDLLFGGTMDDGQRALLLGKWFVGNRLRVLTMDPAITSRYVDTDRSAIAYKEEDASGGIRALLYSSTDKAFIAAGSSKATVVRERLFDSTAFANNRCYWLEYSATTLLLDRLVLTAHPEEHRAKFETSSTVDGILTSLVSDAKVDAFEVLFQPELLDVIEQLLEVYYRAYLLLELFDPVVDAYKLRTPPPRLNRPAWAKKMREEVRATLSKIDGSPSEQNELVQTYAAKRVPPLRSFEAFKDDLRPSIMRKLAGPSSSDEVDIVGAAKEALRDRQELYDQRKGDIDELS